MGASTNGAGFATEPGRTTVRPAVVYRGAAEAVVLLSAVQAITREGTTSATRSVTGIHPDCSIVLVAPYPMADAIFLNDVLSTIPRRPRRRPSPAALTRPRWSWTDISITTSATTITIRYFRHPGSRLALTLVSSGLSSALQSKKFADRQRSAAEKRMTELHVSGTPSTCLQRLHVFLRLALSHGCSVAGHVYGVVGVDRCAVPQGGRRASH